MGKATTDAVDELVGGASANGAVADFDFGYAHIDEAIKELPLPWLRGEPVLLVKPATEANEKFRAAMLRTSGKRQRNVLMKGKVDAADADQDRDDDRALYPRYVIVGWRNVKNKEGKPVEFTIDACLAFIAALPNWIFDKIRVFCMRPENFVDVVDEDPASEPLAKNS